MQIGLLYGVIWMTMSFEV